MARWSSTGHALEPKKTLPRSEHYAANEGLGLTKIEKAPEEKEKGTVMVAFTETGWELCFLLSDGREKEVSSEKETSRGFNARARTEMKAA